ncbi:UNVERIFIED_CONTAM: hypothetical protein K2H54_017506 [Gekko kuhli]
MSAEEEEVRLPGDQTPGTTVLVTTIPTTMVAPVTIAPTTLPALLGYYLPDLGGLRSHIMGARRKTRGAYQWSMVDSNTQELWSLTPKMARKSWYEYELLHEAGIHPWRIEEEGNWEERLACLKGLQDRLIQTIEETLLGILAIMAQTSKYPPRPPAQGAGTAPGPPKIIPKGLLNARFDGTPEKLMFLMVQQGKRTVQEYTEAFERYSVKVRGWPDGVLAEQFRVGLHPEIRENILQSVRPISFSAWVREAADTEARLQMIKMDNPTPIPQIGGPNGKVKGPKPKTDTWELHMKQGLCLHCGEAGHYATACPGMGRGPALAKDPGKKKPDTPLKKGPVKTKAQQALQFEVLDKRSGSTSGEEEELAGKGWDLQ